MTKSQIVQYLAEATNLPKAQVENLLNELSSIAVRELRESEEFTIPGMVKIVVAKRAARPGRKGTNPFTGKPMVIAPKPATRVLKARIARAFSEEALTKKKRGGR
jgi:nucleoid DNA-binding protein